MAEDAIASGLQTTWIVYGMHRRLIGSNLGWGWRIWRGEDEGRKDKRSPDTNIRRREGIQRYRRIMKRILESHEIGRHCQCSQRKCRNNESEPCVRQILPSFSIRDLKERREMPCTHALGHSAMLQPTQGPADTVSWVRDDGTQRSGGDGRESELVKSRIVRTCSLTTECATRFPTYILVRWIGRSSEQRTVRRGRSTTERSNLYIFYDLRIYYFLPFTFCGVGHRWISRLDFNIT